MNSKFNITDISFELQSGYANHKGCDGYYVSSLIMDFPSELNNLK